MRKFRIPYIPYRSLLLSTTVINDMQYIICIYMIYMTIHMLLNKSNKISGPDCLNQGYNKCVFKLFC